MKPCLIVEVRSPGMAMIDRREKASAYRQIDSPTSYVIVRQDQIRVEHYVRGMDRAWHIELMTDGAVTLRCPELHLALADVYEGVIAHD